MTLVLYCKSRPRGADIAEFSRRNKRIFIGYPPWRDGVQLDRSSVGTAIVDVSKEDLSSAQPPNHRRQFSRNRNLVRKVEAAESAYVIVPRPERGVCLVGRLTGDFRVEDSPPWIDEYLELRKHQRLDTGDESDHIGDIVQCWPVEFAADVPLPHVPGWIRYQLMGRQTAGLVHDVVQDMGEPPVSAIVQAMYEENWQVDLRPTSDVHEIERRLIRWITPTAFEHLAVSLLQLEHPDENWFHVGGSGDGGADGLGFKHGKCSAILQCKWKYSGHLERLASWIDTSNSGLTTYVASLIHKDGPEQENILGRCWFSKKVMEHAARLPQALALGVRAARH